MMAATTTCWEIALQPWRQQEPSPQLPAAYDQGLAAAFSCTSPGAITGMSRSWCQLGLTPRPPSQPHYLPPRGRRVHHPIYLGIKRYGSQWESLKHSALRCWSGGTQGYAGPAANKPTKPLLASQGPCKYPEILSSDAAIFPFYVRSQAAFYLTSVKMQNLRCPWTLIQTLQLSLILEENAGLLVCEATCLLCLFHPREEKVWINTFVCYKDLTLPFTAMGLCGRRTYCSAEHINLWRTAIRDSRGALG